MGRCDRHLIDDDEDEEEEEEDVYRAGNEPSYSGSTRARLEKSSARAQLVS